MISTATDWIRNAKSIAIMTGAGVSAESGIPTFRGAGGLWRRFRAEDLASPQAFARDPKLVWEWYDWRREIVAKAEPNPAHHAIALLQKARRDCTLITQNVDGLHDRAGSVAILKLHGDIWRMRCTRCAAEWPDRRVPLPSIPPKCQCGGMARPAIVWFGEPLPPGIWSSAESAAETCDVLLVVGTSAVVYPAASLIPSARAAGAKVIEVNPEETPVSGSVDCSLRGSAGAILPELAESILQ